MDDPRHSETSAELAEVARRLQQERPTLSGLELDQIKLQVERRAARPKQTFLTKQRRALMKSRMAITSMLILGVLASGGGTGLAISGVSDSGSAGKAQYPTVQDQRGGGGEGGRAEGPNVLGQEEGGDSDVAGAQEGAGGGQGGVQAHRQVSVQDGDDSLPFTGFAAIPLILIGVALLASGVVLRRRLPEAA